jgi:hypothetical protein
MDLGIGDIFNTRVAGNIGSADPRKKPLPPHPNAIDATI